MRKMRNEKRKVTDEDELKAIVEACQTVRLGVIDEEGMFIVPMSFGYEWDADDAEAFCSTNANAPAACSDAEEPVAHLTLWLHSAGEGRKADAFRANSAGGAPVAIEMDCEDGVIEGPYACKYSYAFRSIMGSGRIFAIENGEDKVYGLTKIMEHLAPGAPTAFGPGIIERVSVWRVEVDHLTGKRRELKVPAPNELKSPAPKDGEK